MSVLHVHFVDDNDIHVPNLDGRATGVSPGPFDVTFSTGKTGTVHFDLGWIPGIVDLLVSVTLPGGKSESTRIQDVADPITRPDLQFTFKIPGAKGNWWAELLAKLEAEWAKHKTEIVVGAGAVGVGLVYLASHRRRKEAEQTQQMMMMMAMSRAPPEVATSHLASGAKMLKAAAAKAAKPMEVLKATFKKVSK